MVQIQVEYQGDLRTQATHGPSGNTLITDAPTDNQGKGESFSPTDLVATALGTCMLTIMGIAAKARGLAIEGARATVEKGMAAQPVRHIARLEVVIHVPAGVPVADRAALEAAALACPVAKSLPDSMKVPVRFEWAD